MLRAGLIGLGMMGRHHARVLRSLDGVELVAVADPGGDPHAVAGGLDVLPDVEKLIAAGIDMCVVAVPTALHEEVGLALAAAGVHTLVEKPLASTVAGATPARRRVRSRRAGRRASATSSATTRRCRTCAPGSTSGELGEIYQVITRRQGPFPNRIADVGVVKDLATHDVDSTAWVTQRTYRSVSARTAHKSGRQYEDLVAVVAPALRRHGRQPPRQLAVADEGTRHGRDRRARRVRRRHHLRRPDVPRQRRAAAGVGDDGVVPRRDRGRHDPLRDPQAGAAAYRAGSLPRRRARQTGPGHGEVVGHAGRSCDRRGS